MWTLRDHERSDIFVLHLRIIWKPMQLAWLSTKRGWVWYARKKHVSHNIPVNILETSLFSPFLTTPVLSLAPLIPLFSPPSSELGNPSTRQQMVFERLPLPLPWKKRQSWGVLAVVEGGKKKKSKRNRQNAYFQRPRHSWTEQAQVLWKGMETAWMQIKSPSFLQILS